METGAYELPKMVKEHNYNLHAIEIQIHAQNWAWLAVYVYILGISKRWHSFQIWKVLLHEFVSRWHPGVHDSYTLQSPSLHSVAHIIILLYAPDENYKNCRSSSTILDGEIDEIISGKISKLYSS